MLGSRRDSGNKRVNGGAAFFQLLDWNRGRGPRRRKKTSSSSKSSSAFSVPPPAERDVKNRLPAGDDKVPLVKLLQIVDENYGGFRGRKDEPLAYEPPTSRGYASSAVSIAAADMKDERLRAAGLVARLMGLEFLPNMPPHTNPGEPPLRPDQELLLRRVPKPGPVKRYPDLPARTHPLISQCSEIILYSKPRHQQSHRRNESSSISPCSPRRYVDGISNLSFRKYNRPIGRHLNPSSSHESVDGAYRKPDTVNGSFVDYEGLSHVKHNLCRQKHGLCKDKKPSPCPAVNDNVNNEKQKSLTYLESNRLLSKSSCQVDCTEKLNMEDNYSAQINLKQNYSLHDGERRVLLCEIQQNGCDSKIHARMSSEVGNVEVKTERPMLKKKASRTRRLNNGYQVENNCSSFHKHSLLQNDAVATNCTGLTSSPTDMKCSPSMSMEGTVEESSATYELELADRVPNSRAGQSHMRGSLTLMRDDLGDLLVHKVKELNFIDKDKRDRSSADILEELISAMTEGESISPYHLIDSQFAETRKSSYPGHELNKLQANMIGFNISSRQEGHLHPSPLSILERSFSTGSSAGESVDFTSGKDNHSGTTCCSCCDVSNDYDIDLLDSASSSSVSFSSGKISHLLEGLLIMYKTNLCTRHEREPCCFSEVISNLELILENHRCCQKYEETVMESLILDTLESLVNTCTNPAFNLTSADPGDKSLVRRFFFDCILEHLNLNYNYCFLSVYKGLVKIPLILNCDRLSDEVLHKMQYWTNLAGFVEVDTSFPLPRIDFEAEYCVMGLEMEQHTTDVLINEMIIDILSDWIGYRNACTARSLLGCTCTEKKLRYCYY